MIEAIKAFVGGYRAVSIKETRGREGVGFTATLAKDGKVLGEIFDYGDGGCVGMRFANPDDEKALIAFSKEKYPDMKFEPEGMFLGALVDYELVVKKLRTKAAKCLMVADEKQVDEHGVATAYTVYKLEPTLENKAKVLAKYPQTKFLNDELNLLENLKVVSRRK